MAFSEQHGSTLRLDGLEPWMDDTYARGLCDLMGWPAPAVFIPRTESTPDTVAPLNPGHLLLTFTTPQTAASILVQIEEINATQAHSGLSPILMPNSTRPLQLSWASPAESLLAAQHVPRPPSIVHSHSADGTLSDDAGATNSSGGTGPRPVEYSIFVGDLAPDVTSADLVQVFKNPSLGLQADREPRSIRPFESCRSAKIMVDIQTGTSRGYGFVRFTEEAEQRRALIEMQGLYCRSRPMRISHATAKSKGAMTTGRSPPGATEVPLYGELQVAHPRRVASVGEQSSVSGTPSVIHQQMRSISSPIAAAVAARASLSSSAASSSTLSSQHSVVPNRAVSGSALAPPSSDKPTTPAPGPLTDQSILTSLTSEPMQIIDIPPQLLATIVQLVQEGKLTEVVKAQLKEREERREFRPAPEHQPRFHDRFASDPTSYSSQKSDAGGRNSSEPGFLVPKALDGLRESDRQILANMPAGGTGNSTDPYNTTVFVGGLSALIQEDTLRSFFAPFGDIHYVKIPPGKGCGFVQFVHKADAQRALDTLQGYSLGGSKMRLSWGRSQYKAAQAAAQATQLGINMGELASLTERERERTSVSIPATIPPVRTERNVTARTQATEAIPRYASVPPPPPPQQNPSPFHPEAPSLASQAYSLSPFMDAPLGRAADYTSTMSIRSPASAQPPQPSVRSALDSFSFDERPQSTSYRQNPNRDSLSGFGASMMQEPPLLQQQQQPIGFSYQHQQQQPTYQLDQQQLHHQLLNNSQQQQHHFLRTNSGSLPPFHNLSSGNNALYDGPLGSRDTGDNSPYRYDSQGMPSGYSNADTRLDALYSQQHQDDLFDERRGFLTQNMGSLNLYNSGASHSLGSSQQQQGGPYVSLDRRNKYPDEQ